MIHNKLLEALSYLECWDITKLKDEYKKEGDKESNGQNKTDSAENSEALLFFLQTITIKGQSDTDTTTIGKELSLDLLIDEIDKKIAELEREEEENQTLYMLSGLKPMYYSSSYINKFNYIKVVLQVHICINNWLMILIIHGLLESPREK